MNELISQKPDAFFWFRRDLRLHDNAGLFQALKNHKNVLPVFVFDTHILNKLEDKRDRRVEFLHLQLQEMQRQLTDMGSSMLVFYGEPEAIWAELVEQFSPQAVYANHDYEPYAKERDTKIAQVLERSGVAFRTFKDHVIMEKEEVTKDDGGTYSVYTPYSRRWRAKASDAHFESYDTESLFGHWCPAPAQEIPSLEQMGFSAVGLDFPATEANMSILKRYAEQRNFPSVRGTSRLGVHLRFGTISIRELARTAKAASDTFLNELIWRDFYAMILWNHPHVVNGSFRPKYDHIEWRNNETEFEAWCKGKTGYPIVDAGMRELNGTGFMHNRVRMITASFLVKHLLIDWRWGEAYFAKKLLDFDLASNNGGWQWASGSGCDAAPYFRVFNPAAQTKKFDPELRYVRRWVPEFQELTYTKPIVDHKFGRQRAIDTYKASLS